ncbi:hypothetical protein DFH05DRAFT_1525205 [Lentinula detonsa]|uniref:ARID domain-containing protein n=1 Tax=Lentinula detonsa TaxID=2804962 RepID=A0A9W8P026_9AGAR|nr:hypothetical protein DFH05DRAFT_1525205 [Lentinula detonsa]
MQSQQQRFGLAIGSPGPSQQPSFLDQPNQTQHNIPMGFTGMGQHNPSYQSMQHRQNMLHALQGNQQHSRQLELMGLAQNQQNQNGPTNLVNRGVPMNGTPQGLNPHQSQNDMFSSPNEMRRPSPHPSMQPPSLNNQPANANGMNFRGTVNIGGRPINLGDLTERANTLRGLIQQQEMQIHQLQAQRPNINDNVFMNRMRSSQSELAVRKESLNKIVTLMNICIQQGNGGNGPMNGVGGPSQGPPPTGNSGQPWQTSPFGNAAQSQPQPTGPGPRSSPAPPHHQSGLSVNSPSNVPPRTGPTPQQQQLNPFSMNGSPLNFPINNATANGAPGPNIGPNMSAPSLNAPVPPLDKSRFETSYKQWCLTKAIVHDPRLLAFENRQIDLFLLHCLVMREGGIATVTRKELWPVIAGRLGIINFPGEPPRSGPVAAMHVQNVYKEYLAAFDTLYTASVMDSRRKASHMPGSFPPQSMPFTLEALRSLNPQQVRMIIACADKTPAELKARGMSDPMISFVENNRASLQSMSADQENFGTEIRRAQLPQGPMPGNVVHNGNIGQPFSNPGNMNQPFNRSPGDLQPPFPSGSQISRPSREQLNMAHMNIQRNKADFTSQVLPMMPSVDVSLDSRAEYNNTLEMTLRAASDLDNKLALYSVVTKSEDQTKKLSIAIVSVQHQRNLLTSPNPKFIISLETLRAYSHQFQSASRSMAGILHSMFRGEYPTGGPPTDQRPIHPGAGARVMPPGQPLLNPQHPSGPNNSNQPNTTLPSRPPIPLNSPQSTLKTKKPSGAPTPPASAPTPVANTPTPAAAAASPQTPKSPKPKAPVKKLKQRKTSTQTATSKVIATPTLEHTTIGTSSTSGLKRPREEEIEAAQPSTSGSNTLPTAANEPSPPKRAKTEWEGPVSDALQKKNQAVENIKTEEEASQFLQQMAQLIQMAGAEDQAALSSDISETLEQFLKGYDGGDSSNTFSTLGLNEAGSLDASASTSQIPSSNDLTEFFDFSLFSNEEEDESKVGTPDLVSSSSTNPSPESQADADPAHHATALLDVKQEEYDPLRLGTLKEIDGGESAYYQSTDWKWDGPMPTLDQPWAIFNS